MPVVPVAEAGRTVAGEHQREMVGDVVEGEEVVPRQAAAAAPSAIRARCGRLGGHERRHQYSRL